jgi:N-acetylglucosaminyl-diphospho-decaprenol L-rhamnosyltransferase
MFMVFNRAVFDQVGGFNERYFLYYEDVELCARLQLAGLRVVVKPGAQVVHHAQRSSHRNLKYLRWHVGSLLRFLTSSEYRQLKRLQRL